MYRILAITQKIFNLQKTAFVRSHSVSLPLVVPPPSERLQPDRLSILSSLKSYTVNRGLIEGRILHAHIIYFQILDVALYTALITMYGKCSSVNEAVNTFDHMPTRSVVSWNALIAVFILHENYQEALLYFRRMQEDFVQPDNVTCISVVSACANQNALEEGMDTHNLTTLCGYDTHVELQNALIHMYGRCRCLGEALSVFKASSQDDIISWNSMMSAYSCNGWEALAQKLFNEMVMKAMVPNRVSYVIIISVLANQGAAVDAKWIHATLVGSVIEFESVLATTLINLYGKGGSLSDSRKVFDRMINPSVVSWNAFVAIHAQNDERKLAQQLFYQMHQESIVSTGLTFVSILDTFDKTSSLNEGKRLHVLIRGNNLEKELVVGNALIGMYGKCQSFSSALQLLDGMRQRNDLTWTIMMANCARSDHGVEVFKFFDQMLQEASLPDKLTFIAILDACANQVDLTRGVHMHALLAGSPLLLDNYVGNALLNMYSKCGKMSMALEMFDMLQEHEVISWTTLVSGYAQQRQIEEALFFFIQMCQEGVMPNKITYVSVLAVCSIHALLLAGKRIHAVVNNKLEADIVISNALLNLYGKCGCLEDVRGVFDSMLQRDAISWSAMICAHAYHGEATDVLQLFHLMQEERVRPNTVTFVSIISAWGHSGRVEEGYFWFLLMGRRFGIPPVDDHYTCMIDLSGRAGRLDEAEAFLARGASHITIASIMALLSACKFQDDVERGERFARHAFILFPENAEPYIMLANIYSSVGRVEDARIVLSKMKSKGLEAILH